MGNELNLLLQYLGEIIHCETIAMGLRDSVSVAEQNKLTWIENSPQEPCEPTKPDKFKILLGNDSLGEVIGAILQFSLSLGFIGFIIDVFRSCSKRGDFLIFTLLGAIVVPIAVIIVGLFVWGIKVALSLRNYESDCYEYNKKLKEYKKDVARRKITQKNLEMKESDLEGLLNDTEKVIQELYSVGIIYNKYRNLTAIASFCDYLSAGRTKSLGRMDNDPGAYNIYEEDLRAQKIIDVMKIGFSQISGQLSQIQANQYTLYSSINETNSILKSINSELGNINHSLSESSVFCEENANNTRILVDLQRDRWGDLYNLDGHVVSNQHGKKR